jgi:uncharacterized protein YggT (Ycf19 family)
MDAIIEFFNNLSWEVSNFSWEVALDAVVLSIVHNLAVFLINIVSYFYVLLKFFKVLCYSRLTFEWFPMINPYVWPFSIFQTLTGPYFAFWARVLPNIKLQKSSLEISSIIALESLNSMVFFLMILTQELIHVLGQTELAMIRGAAAMAAGEPF